MIKKIDIEENAEKPNADAAINMVKIDDDEPGPEYSEETIAKFDKADASADHRLDSVEFLEYRKQNG